VNAYTIASDLFETIHRTLHGESHRPEWYDADCPFCGKEAKRGQVHFSYSESGYKCFVCSASGNLRTLADRLNLGSDIPYTPPVRREPAPKLTPYWRLEPEELLDRYATHPERYRAWASHKPLKPETIDRFGFGFGQLPFQHRETGDWYLGSHNRLIVPIWQGSDLMALRGRAVVQADTGMKWMSATGSQQVPWGMSNVQRGGIVWLCENYVDAAWLMQERPDESAIGLGGVSMWKTEHSLALARCKPLLVIVALDNDLVGQAQGEMRKRLEAEWRSDPKHNGQPPPPSNGERILRELRSVGLDARLFEWPCEAPAKAGLDWILGMGDRT
jgi:hypothetical protein